MKRDKFSKAVDEVVKLKLKAVDEYIEEIIEPLADVGSPERLLGKKYADWSDADLQRLSRIYGTKEPNPLSETIFNNEYKELKAMEA